jgi:peroxiredoxin Q/BCP
VRTVSVLCLAALAVILGSQSPAADEKVDLKPGDPAPTFTSTDDQGKPWKSADYVGKKILVVYFYPADMTGGCTKQACAFRDDMQKLTDKGVEVVGVSGDSVKNHQVFKEVHKLNFTLLADEAGSVAQKFGVPINKDRKDVKTKDAAGNPVVLTRQVTAQRWTFVIGKDGKIAYKNPKVTPAQDSAKILEVVDGLEKK